MTRFDAVHQAIEEAKAQASDIEALTEQRRRETVERLNKEFDSFKKTNQWDRRYKKLNVG